MSKSDNGSSTSPNCDNIHASAMNNDVLANREAFQKATMLDVFRQAMNAIGVNAIGLEAQSKTNGDIPVRR